MLYESGDVARLYHLNSSVSSRTVVDPPGTANGPGPREFPKAPRIALTAPGCDPDPELDLSLGETLRRRHSGREFALAPLPKETLGRLLAASCAVRPSPGRDPHLPLGRAAPSAGGLHPLETYVLTQQVEAMDDGLYHYDPHRHDLAHRRSGPLIPELAPLCFGQEYLAQASVVVCLTVLPQRGLWKYGERAYRYALLEAGHVGQNLLLIAEALGLAAVAIGGFFDADVNRLLDLPTEQGQEQEQAIYHLAIGQRPARNPWAGVDRAEPLRRPTTKRGHTGPRLGNGQREE